MREEIWYAADGTNMALDRLTCYLAGGTPPGAGLACPGSRDPSPPGAVRPLELAGSVYFAWESPTWGGGVAFYDPTDAGSSVARGYLLTREQFSDVAAQEMHRPAGADLDLDGLLSTGVCTFGPGRYETMHVVGAVDDAPVVTFTASSQGHTNPYNPPSAAYVATMGRGLLEAHDWSVAEAVAYLASRPGIGPDWTESALARRLTKGITSDVG